MMQNGNGIQIPCRLRSLCCQVISQKTYRQLHFFLLTSHLDLNANGHLEKEETDITSWDV